MTLEDVLAAVQANQISPESAEGMLCAPPGRSEESGRSAVGQDVGHKPVARDAVAIIGISGAFPKARDVTEFWENLAQGRDCISEVPAQRWSLEQLYDADEHAPGKTHCRWLGVLEEMDRFDPLFFNISPVEAQAMDPQQRLVL